MASVSKKLYECEHCDNTYKSRGPKSNHKFSRHYGGYDCDQCPGNYKSRELLNIHYVSKHGQKTDPNVDFGHLNKVQRDDMDRIGLMRKQNGLPGIILSKEIPPFMLKNDSQIQEKTDPVETDNETVPTCIEERSHTTNLTDPKIESVTGPAAKSESLIDMRDIENMDIIDLEANNVASHENTCLVVDRLMSKDVRLGVNLRAEIYQMVLTAEKLFDAGKHTTEEILDHIRPKCNV
jgi:hypothetical protein